MKTFRITVNNIDGIYEGNSRQEAINNYAKDAGYKSYDDMIDQIPELADDEVEAIEIPSPRSTSEALDLDDNEWESFVMKEAGIVNAHDPDGNGLHLEDILEKDNRQKILKYLGWY